MTLTDEEVKVIESCLTLPEDMAEATDFKANEAINLDMSIKLPSFYSLGEWIYETSNQGAIGSCTAMGTSHATQILNVKKGGVKPTNSNILTPDWKDLWSKMGHDPYKYDGGDYVERAVNTALKEGIKTVEKGDEVKFDGYAYGEWERSAKGIEMMKRYIYNGNPIVWCVRGDQKMWNEMTAGEIKHTSTNTTGGHCIAVVGFDEGGFWFINSWRPNDDNKRKSRFYVSNAVMKTLPFNRRYRILYIKEDAAKDPNYLKRKNQNLLILQVMKKNYENEPEEVKRGIVAFSQAARKAYPEINSELPL